MIVKMLMICYLSARIKNKITQCKFKFVLFENLTFAIHSNWIDNRWTGFTILQTSQTF